MLQTSIVNPPSPTKVESPQVASPPKQRVRKYNDDLVQTILAADTATPPVPAMSGKDFLAWVNSQRLTEGG